MNFKEIYKSANDEIRGDRSLIDAVIKKSEKKPVYKMAYPLACAAAALVIVVAVSVYPKNPVKEMPGTNIASNNINKKADVNIEPKTEISADPDVKKDVSLPEKTENAPDEYKYEAKTDAAQESGSAPVVQNEEKTNAVQEATEDKASQKEISAEITESLSNPMVVMLEVNDIEPSVTSTASYARTGSGGGAALKTANVEFEGMTAQQYYEYIGTDITKKIQLPDGMQFEEFFGTTVKRNMDTQSVISDNAEFYAEGENKFVSLTTSKMLGDAENKLGDETLKKSDVMGTPAVVEGYETTHRVYVKYSDVYYNVYSEGLTLEEIEKLLISICKN